MLPPELADTADGMVGLRQLANCPPNTRTAIDMMRLGGTGMINVVVAKVYFTFSETRQASAFTAFEEN